MRSPWLSVIMPTYNGAAYLAEALESIVAQGPEDIEVLAVDDGSTDDTPSILEAYSRRLPLRIFSNRVGNWVANTNFGLARARGEYACILHQDDVWLPGRLRAQRRLLRRVPGSVLVLHPSWFIDARGRRLGMWRCPLPEASSALGPGVVVERLLVQNFIAMPAPIFPRRLASREGLNEELWYTADWDFWLRAAQAGPTVYYPRPLAAFRIHPESQTARGVARAAEMHRQSRWVLEKHLPAWKARHPGRPEVGRVARLAVDVNHALASLASGGRPDWLALAWRFLEMGPPGWHRFLRDSRIVERLLARLKVRWWGAWDGPAGVRAA